MVRVEIKGTTYCLYTVVTTSYGITSLALVVIHVYGYGLWFEVLTNYEYISNNYNETTEQHKKDL